MASIGEGALGIFLSPVIFFIAQFHFNRGPLQFTLHVYLTICVPHWAPDDASISALCPW